IERSLHARLFARSKRSVALTSAGVALLAEARQAVTQFERAIDAGRRAGRGQLGRVEVGYVGSAVFSGILQQRLQRFRRASPDVLVQARELPMDSLPDLLDSGAVDIAFVRMPIRLDHTLRTHVLLQDRFCIALPAAHHLAASSLPVKPRDLKETRFVVPEQEQGTWEVGRRGRFMPQAGSSPGSLFEVLTQVSLGVGIAIVPNVLARAMSLPGVVFKPLAGTPIKSEVAAVYRRHERSPEVINLIEQVAQTQP